MMMKIQHTKLETHDGKHGEQEVDPSVMLEFFLQWTPHHPKM
jgi:hypothetical protein